MTRYLTRAAFKASRMRFGRRAAGDCAASDPMRRCNQWVVGRRAAEVCTGPDSQAWMLATIGWLQRSPQALGPVGASVLALNRRPRKKRRRL